MLGALGSQGFRLLTSAREPPKDSSQPADDGVAPPIKPTLYICTFPGWHSEYLRILQPIGAPKNKWFKRMC